MFNTHSKEIPKKVTIPVGQKIRQAREESWLDLEALAKAAHLKPYELSAYENGTKVLRVDELIYLAEALNKPLTYFFPDWIVQRHETPGITPNEFELLRLFGKLSAEDQVKIFAIIHAWQHLENLGLE